MKQRIFLLFMVFSICCLLLGAPVAEAQGEEVFVRTRPIPEALKDVAEPYEGSLDKEGVNIRISLPEILLDSSDAQSANEEIKGLEDSLIEDYQQSYSIWKEETSQGEDYPFYFYSICYYEANVFDGILSLRIIDSNGMDGALASTTIYNFDVESGKRLSDVELVSRLSNIPVGEIDMDLLLEENIVREARKAGDQLETQMSSYYFTSDMTDFTPSFIGLSDQSVGETLEMCREDAAENAMNGKKTSLLFLDDNAAIQMIYRQQTPAGAGFYYSEAPFYPILYPRERLLNPVYVKILKDLGEDPWNNSYDGLVAFLGSATERSALHELLYKVSTFSSKWNNYMTPSPILSYDYGEDTNWTQIATYSEFYLVIPRYANDYIEICELELDPSGQIEEKALEDRSGALYGRAFGVGIVGITSETMPTGGLRFSNLKERGELWYPSISGKDGSLVLPEGTLDITDALDRNHETLKESANYVDDLLEDFIDANWPRG